MRKDDEKLLITQCLAGHAAAFEPLVERYHRVLFNLALRMVGNEEDARDITQTTFLKAFENLDRYDPKHKFFSWVYRIAVNESLNHRNRTKSAEPLEHAQIANSPKPDEEYEKLELGRSVQSAILQLPADSRHVLVLRHFADLSYREISAVLAIPEKTVKSRLYDARRKLCTILLHRRAKT